MWRKRSRLVIGWIAAYALVLNTILTGFAAHTAVSDPAAAFDQAAIICLTSADMADGASGGTAPAEHTGNHCVLCVCTPMAGPLSHVVQLLRAAIEPVHTPIPAGQTPAADTKTLPGQPRAPPRTV
jgi:hypothetical protein